MQHGPLAAFPDVTDGADYLRHVFRGFKTIPMMGMRVLQRAPGNFDGAEFNSIGDDHSLD